MVRASTSRLDRDQWLAHGLEVLAAEGSAGLSLNNMIEQFHVTKGSFYWHFENQADFQSALIDYWHEEENLAIGATAYAAGDGAEERLRELMQLVIVEDHNRFDAVLSVLAIQNPSLKPKLHAAYEFRINWVRKRFQELGYRGEDLALRTRMFVAFMMSESTVSAGLGMKKRLAQAARMLSILIDER